MYTRIHVYTKSKADRLEALLGYRISGHEVEKRPGQPDRIRVIPAKKHQ